MWPIFSHLNTLATATKADDWHYLIDPRVGIRVKVGYACAMTLSIQRDRLTDPMRHIE